MEVSWYFNQPALPCGVQLVCARVGDEGEAGETDYCCEEKVVREEFHIRHFNMAFQAVNFDTLRVVDVCVLFLSYCEEEFVVKPSVNS